MKHTREIHFLCWVTIGFVAVGEIIGIPLVSAMAAPAMVLPDIISPISATAFSFSISLETAFADSTLSDLVSANFTSIGRPRTSGLIFFAIEMPLQPIPPYAATFPVIDRYAPMTTGSADRAADAKTATINETRHDILIIFSASWDFNFSTVTSRESIR